MPQKLIPKKDDLTLEEQAKQDKSKRMAEGAVSADLLNASLAQTYYKYIFTDIDMIHLVKGIKLQVEEVKAGDMSSMEGLLVAQANSLQIMFVSLGRMALNSTQLDQRTAYINLALKAQSQSRATVQALVELKSPKQATFVKQANIANGNQQINNHQSNMNSNGSITRARAHAKEISNPPNELLTSLDKSKIEHA